MPEVNFEQTTPKPSSSLKPILVALGIIALVGASAYAGYCYGKQQVPPPPAPTPEVTPPVTEVPESTPPAKVDETVGWKTYTGDKIEFKYPENLTLKEVQKDLFNLLPGSEDPKSAIISIDARLKGNYANYDTAVASTKAGLVGFQSQDITGGVKITGKIGPGYGQGQAITIALFKYQKGVIEAETTSTDTNQLQTFDQILSTFKFLE